MTDTTATEPAKRTRRAEPINKHTAKSGAVSYWFQIDLGERADGTRNRRRFTFRTQAEARKEFRRISAEVAAGTYARPTTITVDEACTAWLDGRRGIREITRRGYVTALKPVRRHLGGKQLQKITKADVDGLVTVMLTSGRQSVVHRDPNSLAGCIAALIAAHPDGISARDIQAAFPGQDVHTRLAELLKYGRVTRPRRAFYVPAEGVTAGVTATRGGVKPITVRATLTAFQAVVKSYVDEGVLVRNVVSLVERPKDSGPVDDENDQHVVAGSSTAEPTFKSWTADEAQTFRQAVRDDRLFACWLLSLYGLRRSEVLGLRWSAVDLDTGTVAIRRGRVAVGSTTVVGAPKSERGKRELPIPDDLAEALRTLKLRAKRDALAAGLVWSEERYVAAREDGEPVSPEWYSDEFHRLRKRTGLPRVKLHGLRNTSVTLMLDRGIPVHTVAAWHGHDPSMTLSVYSDAKADELRTAGAALFG